MNGGSVVIKRAGINSVLPGNPWVTACLQADQNLAPLLPGGCFFKHAHFAGFCLFYVFCIAFAKRFAVQFAQIRRSGGVEHVPVLVGVNTLHKFVTYIYGNVSKPGAVIWVAVVFAQVHKLRKVKVPVFHIYGGSTSFFTFTAHGKQRGIDHFHKWQWPGAHRVGSFNRASGGAEFVHAYPNAARTLGDPHGIPNAFSNALHVVFYINHKTVAKLRKATTSIHPRAATWQVFQLAHMFIKI